MDCSDLLDMTTSPMEWPSFASKIDDFQSLHDNFESVNLYHILGERMVERTNLQKKLGLEV